MNVAGVVFFLIAAPIAIGIVVCLVSVVGGLVTAVKNDYQRDEED